MSEGNESYLRFSLEESVWFQKGQEVAELISISLDPNISIHENDQYVTIEGALQLSGEYKRHPAEMENEEGSFSPKFVQQVEEREEGMCEFVHRFPVDITIPNNRIQSIYDIDVEIESFDYAFPERSCMKLTADLTISGLYGDQQHVVVENEEEVVLEPLNREAEEEVNIAPLRAEAQAELETEDAEPSRVEEPEVSVSANDLYTPFAAEARKEPDEEETINENEQASFVNQQWEPEKNVSVEVQEEPQKPVEPAPPEISFSAQRQEEKYESPDVYESPEANLEAGAEYEESPDAMESSSSSEPVVKKKKKKSKKDSMSLTEFFARKDEAEDVVRLKVCIVQSGDTIDHIAERYEVPAQQLLKVNQLELNQDVYEGQVLYIPMAVSQK
ncbi:stage VI sporulation protein D [Bacillus dakarensis]|uniref:stage VI sporulation protein D n=1 Tax=Robertmurraya dakarensis TaxID=1926278 RepID=UPI000981A75E|nr:stage VI sporulation protein D [Bacillus dakarensis]